MCTGPEMDIHLLCQYFIVLLLLIPFGSSLTCYQCSNSDYPALCKTTEHCHGVNQACIVTETVDSNFQLKYNLGCVDRNFCAGLPIVGEQHFVGKRTLEYQCCVTNHCNHAKPSHLPHPLQLTTTTSTTHRTTTTARRNKCLPNWTQYGHNCYVYLTHSATWNKAKESCSSMNGWLLTIENEKENVFLSNVTKGHFSWTGGSVSGSGSNVDWVDHKHHNYVHWASNEPHRKHGVDTVCILYNGQTHLWRARGCNEAHPYVCKANAFH